MLMPKAKRKLKAKVLWNSISAVPLTMPSPFLDPSQQ